MGGFTLTKDCEKQVLYNNSAGNLYSISPQSDKLAVWNDNGFYVIDINQKTGKLIKENNIGRHCSPFWAKIGNLIAFTCSSKNWENIGLYLIDSEGGNFVKISDTGFSPVWAPSGDKVAFIDTGEIIVFDVKKNERAALIGIQNVEDLIDWRVATFLKGLE